MTLAKSYQNWAQARQCYPREWTLLKETHCPSLLLPRPSWQLMKNAQFPIRPEFLVASALVALFKLWFWFSILKDKILEQHFQPKVTSAKVSDGQTFSYKTSGGFPKTWCPVFLSKLDPLATKAMLATLAVRLSTMVPVPQKIDAFKLFPNTLLRIFSIIT